MKNKWMSFKKARKFARELGLGGHKDWEKYCRLGNKPLNIPNGPHRIYKEWINWMDWLGTNNIVGSCRKYVVNDNFFKKWSHNMAYILGFWFADGCITGGNVFKIAQHKKDKYLLIDILRCMGSTYKVISHNNMSYIIITSNTIVQDIRKLGGKEKKSLNVKFPYVPIKYLPDFIRGVWDGDGCISIYKNKDINGSVVSGSKLFIKLMAEKLRENISGFKCRTIGRKNKGKKTIYYRIILGANASRCLRDYMYRNKVLFLKRKYDKFVKIGDINIATYDRKYLSYNKALLYVQKLGLRGFKDWFSFSKSNRRPPDIPSNPWKIYRKDGWINLREFLGY